MKKRWLTLMICLVAVLGVLITVVVITAAANNTIDPGDFNGDRTVDSRDLIYLRQYLAAYDYSNSTPPQSHPISVEADMNGDDEINLRDVVDLRNYLANRTITITPNEDGSASVKTTSGLEYTVSDHSDIVHDQFTFSKGNALTVTFDETLFASEFNRVVFGYKTDVPLMLSINYTRDGEDKTDYFFLLPEDTSFRGLVEEYVYGKQGTNLISLTVEPCENVEASFILDSFSTELIPVYADDLCVENDRYKIGVRLSWGGAMTYFEDKLDGDEELGNLVNIHDTGRLIQQSFYGTYTNNDTDSLFGEGYVSVPNGDSDTASKWSYNPVQGGDRKNNGSDRLIDVETGVDASGNPYIYIVSQSLDWAYVKGNTYDTIYDGLTYTYYENTYTIMEGEDEGTDDDYVLVDNVMTDFSGWTHVAGGQEIPAVYLVSYFDTLSFYNGVKPWTGDNDNVFYEAELEGWSNSKNFPLYRGNTETWSIWLNTTETGEGEEDFGFGTYCPNIQKHIAIRHQYDGSKDPMSNSTSYVAPSCSIVMQSYKPIEYSYIFATGSFDQIRDVFTENKDFANNPDLSENRYDQLITYGEFDMMNMDFSVESNADIFHAPKHIQTSYDSVEEALKLYIDNSNDPYVSLNFDWNSEETITAQNDFNTIEITYMLPETNSKTSDILVLFLSAGDQSKFDESHTVKGTVVRDGEYHTLSIRVPKNKCSGEMHSIRFDPFTQPAAVGDVMYVKSIKLTTQDYPDIAVDNDMTSSGMENLFSFLNYTGASFDKTQNAVVLERIGGNDVYASLDFSSLNLSTVEYPKLVVEYMVPTTNSQKSYGSTLFYSTSDGGISSEKTVTATLTVDGQYHTATFDLSGEASWTGNVAVMRLDYFNGTCAEGDKIYIKRIALVRADGFMIDLSQEGSESNISSSLYTNVAYDSEQKAIAIKRTNGVDVNVTFDLSSEALSTDDYKKILVRYMIPTDNSKTAYSSAIYFSTTDGGIDGTRVRSGSLIVDGQYHTLVLDLADHELWTGSIAKLRLDYFEGSSSEGDTMYIEYILVK